MQIRIERKNISHLIPVIYATKHTGITSLLYPRDEGYMYHATLNEKLDSGSV
jgi:hypothetical protein